MNVTKSHILKKEIKGNEKMFRMLFDNAPDAMVVIDECSEILLWNPKSEDIFGWSSDEVIGKNIVEMIIPFPYKQDFLNETKGISSTGSAGVLNNTIEITATNKEKGSFSISLSIAASDWNDKQVFIYFIRQSVGEKNPGISLEQLISELTDKNIELERMNNELSSFSYVAGHDLKEPLRKIRTYSNFILEKNSNALPLEAREYLQRIINSTSNMQKLIDDLLAFSRTASSEKTYKPVDLNTLLNDVKFSLKETMDEKNAVITAGVLPTIKLIPFQFQQLLENIISNAIKYNKPGVGPQITITSDMVSGKNYLSQGANSEKLYTKISIADNGIGFEPQYAERIFELFQRLHGKDEYPGTGIGLAICKKIAINHNGFITAEGKEGSGSTFNIFVPIE
jgi:PAS domain S-box-containing protein